MNAALRLTTESFLQSTVPSRSCFPMHKILISEPRIGSYSVLLLLGLLGGYLITRWRAVRAGVKGAHIDNLALLIAVLSLFGARFFSWLFYFPAGVSLWAALRDTGGGMVFYGGLIFGIVTVVLYARAARLPLGNLVDVFAPGLALGLALGRVGCFMAGCCWGDVCLDPKEVSKFSSPGLKWQLQTFALVSPSGFPIAVQFPKGAGAFEQHRKLGLIDDNATASRPVHPVQLYEAGLALALCLFLHLYFEKRQWHGQVFCLLILSYSGIRFATEFLRADNRPIYFGLTLSQVISIGLATMAVLVMTAKKRRTILNSNQLSGAGIPQAETL